MEIHQENAERLGCNNPKCSFHIPNSIWLCNRKCLNNYNSLLLAEQAVAKRTLRIKQFILDNPQPKCGYSKCDNLCKLDVKYWKWAKTCDNSSCASKMAYETRCNKLGVTTIPRSDASKQKYKETNLNLYGCEYASQSEEFRLKFKATCLERYGSESPLQSELIKDKIHKTMSERYGGIGSQVKSIRDKMTASCFKNYGVLSPLQSDIIKERFKRTCIERYGYEYASQSEEIKQKSRDTCLAKRGVLHPSHDKNWLLLKRNSNIVKYGGPFYKYADYTIDGINLMKDENFLDLVELNKTLSLLEISKLHGMSVSALRQRFTKHGIEAIGYTGISSFHAEVVDYIKSLGITNIKTNNRKLISPLEIDIIVNDTVLIECNGTYWHSELNGKDKHYHLNKTQKCNDLGYHLLHIWGHDWENKTNIIKSILANTLSKSCRIFARKTKVIKLSKLQEKQFFNANHIQGFIGSTICYGLIENDIIVAAMSFGKPRFNKNYEYELIRYAALLNHSVIGGPSKLLAAFVKDFKPASIISYCARERFQGKVYENLGFDLMGFSSPSYSYTNFSEIHNRMKFQKHKLKDLLPIFNAQLSEAENMKNNNWHKLWDCGNRIYSKIYSAQVK